MPPLQLPAKCLSMHPLCISMPPLCTSMPPLCTSMHLYALCYVITLQAPANTLGLLWRFVITNLSLHTMLHMRLFSCDMLWDACGMLHAPPRISTPPDESLSISTHLQASQRPAMHKDSFSFPPLITFFIFFLFLCLQPQTTPAIY